MKRFDNANVNNFQAPTKKNMNVNKQIREISKEIEASKKLKLNLGDQFSPKSPRPNETIKLSL